MVLGPQDNQRGSVIITLFIMVALFGLVTYAFLSGTRSNITWLSNERAKANTTSGQECTNAINVATQRLKARGCGSMISYYDDGANYNPGAPTDGSCSIFTANGGGVKPCNVTALVNGCGTTPIVGSACPDGTIYAGISPDGSKKMYTTPADGPDLVWGCASSSNCIASPATINQMVTGYTQTQLIAAGGAQEDSSSDPGIQPHPAADYCWNLVAYGYSDWYLPAFNELEVMLNSYNVGALAGTFNASGLYYSTSTLGMVSGLFPFSKQPGSCPGCYSANYMPNTKKVRCVRKAP